MNSLLKPHVTQGTVIHNPPDSSIRLAIPPGHINRYKVAQLDDYTGLSRNAFLRRPPLKISLEARVNRRDIEGTWGFGLWNAPLNVRMGSGFRQLLPAFPNAAWFFYASPENHLSFKERSPGHGFLVQTFRSTPMPLWAFAPAAVFLPLLLVRPAARLIRKLISKRIVEDDSKRVPDEAITDWRRYVVDWTDENVIFGIGGETIHTSLNSPHGPLGVVIWIDNQYAAFTPEGRLSYGTLAVREPAWLEIRDLTIT